MQENATNSWRTQIRNALAPYFRPESDSDVDDTSQPQPSARRVADDTSPGRTPSTLPAVLVMPSSTSDFSPPVSIAAVADAIVGNDMILAVAEDQVDVAWSAVRTPRRPDL